jgi:hypothetical protein
MMKRLKCICVGMNVQGLISSPCPRPTRQVPLLRTKLMPPQLSQRHIGRLKRRNDPSMVSPSPPRFQPLVTDGAYLVVGKPVIPSLTLEDAHPEQIIKGPPQAIPFDVCDPADKLRAEDATNNGCGLND